MDALSRANRHDVVQQGPASRFMEGALLGNGALGAVVTTRPDAVVINLGHNDVWDERMQPVDPSGMLDFSTVFARVQSIAERGGSIEDDPWFAEYHRVVAEPYTRTFPRPYPCGALILGVDRRRTEVRGTRLDIARGEASVTLCHDGRELSLRIFVGADEDVVHLAVVDAADDPVASPFVRVRLLPDPAGADSGPDLTAAESALALTIPGEAPLRPSIRASRTPDALVFTEEIPSDDEDPASRHRIRVSFTSVGRLDEPPPYPTWFGVPSLPTPLEARPPVGLFVAELRLVHERGARTAPKTAHASEELHATARAANVGEWEDYWSRSSVALDHEFLESLWYRNTYFLHCCARSGLRAPGLFGNWSAGQIGTAWHGDYHMNYNTQQVFWGVFASNRVDTHDVYLRLVEELTPLAAKAADEYWGLPGAAYPHTAFPVPMRELPPPSPIWGWEMCETPWIVQSLWWHYLYTRDDDVLRRIVLPLEQATEFMLAYLERSSASGRAGEDGFLHVFPTVVPEVYGLSSGLEFNRDCLADLTLIRFLFRAFGAAVGLLGDEASAGQLSLSAASDAALHRLPEYAVADTPDGDVFVAVHGEDPDVVYNVPVPGMTVFPGEEHGFWSDDETLARARRSVERQRLEGGNELVFAALQRVRLGTLDIDAFVRQVRYCLLPNGTATDMLLETRGRYSDTTAFDFMAGMGVFVENFALTAVVNEMLMQSVHGRIRLFPGLPAGMDASFTTLRAVGAFLVSAEAVSGTCRRFDIRSERGGPLLVEAPWPGSTVALSSHSGRRSVDGAVIEFVTVPGETISFAPAESEKDH